MMTRRRSKTMANLKMLMTLPVVTFLLISFSTYYAEENQISPVSYQEILADNYPSLPPPPLANETHKATVTTSPQSNQYPSEMKKDPYVVVDKMPVFPGGDNELLKYIADNTRYPESAIANNISGRVIVKFCITETGKVDKATVLKGIDKALDAEAIRVVSSIPAFVPGSNKGITVPVWYMVPVAFSLKKDEPAPAPPPVTVSVVKSAEKTAESASAGENPEQKDPYDMPTFVAEKMPAFPGGDRELLKYLAKNTRYPASAEENKITGKVTVKFCVTETGKVDKVSVLKGVHPDLDAEAVRVISGLPDFEPGQQGGKEVPVWYMVPVTFTIR